MNLLELSIVTPRRVAFEGRATSVVVPGAEGDFEVLWNHVPLVSGLRRGRIVAAVEDTTRVFQVTGGFVEVTPDRVRVFVREADLTPP